MFKGEIVPIDTVTNEEDLKKWKNKPNSLSEKSKWNLIRQIRGHIVTFPQFFLSKYDWEKSQHLVVDYLDLLKGPPRIQRQVNESVET